MAATTALANLDTLDVEGLKAIIVAQQEQLLSRDHEIEHLKLLLAQLRRLRFGRKSEKLDHRIEQLELKLEELESRKAKQSAQTENQVQPNVTSTSKPRIRPARRPLPQHLPREIHNHEPQQSACPECGGKLRKLGEDISEILEYVPAYFKVIRHVRPRLTCTGCHSMVQAPAVSRPIERGLAGPGLLAHVLVSKFADYVETAIML